MTHEAVKLWSRAMAATKDLRFIRGRRWHMTALCFSHSESAIGEAWDALPDQFNFIFSTQVSHLKVPSFEALRHQSFGDTTKSGSCSTIALSTTDCALIVERNYVLEW